jgi:predicted Zn finger-like uncharacterized protein
MILTCPNCGTQYVVKDGAIPPQGRQVRCASCKHSWHQDPQAAPELELGAEADEGGSADESFAEAAMIEPRSGPEAEERAFVEAAVEGDLGAEEPLAEPQPYETPSAAAAPADYHPPPEPEAQPDDDFSPFAERDFVEPRRKSPVVAILLVLVLVAALAAAFWFLAPAAWKARVGLTEATTKLELSNPPHIERRQLASGNGLLTIAGRVINPTDETHPVPPIYAQLRDGAGKVIYTWTIAPPAPTLGPGESRSFNSAEVNVPTGGQDLTISLVPPKA